MTNYRDTDPTSIKDLTSDGIMNFFEDERATDKQVAWMKDILSSDEYKANNPISPYNWRKIKTAFAQEFFPEIVPQEKETHSKMKDRILAFLND